MSDDLRDWNSGDCRNCISRLKNGDPDARDEIIAMSRDRLTRLARRMLRDFPGVRRWEETDDVFQTAVVRLCRTLDRVAPENTTALFRLAARDIRCTLIDLARHYGGPEGLGHNHHSASSSAMLSIAETHESHAADGLMRWTEFHESIQRLPGELQEIMDLVWYQGLTQEEAAECLGVSNRTVQRRWREACLELHDALKGLPPGLE